jgi:hypothetical protein
MDWVMDWVMDFLSLSDRMFLRSVLPLNYEPVV